MFSKLQLENPNVLLMDDPTNHLDLESISSLNEALVKYDQPIILKTHDLEIIDTVTNRIIKI
jgi:ATPase subunit of ABC transporter with duplicated ATPase domains